MKAVWCISYILFYSVHTYSFLFGTNGKIETIGYGFIGETLNMTCSITNPSIQKNASDIIFSLNDTELNNTFILGEKSKKLVLQLSGPQMNTAHIYCQVYNPSFTRIDSKIINVEYAPQNITNISCVNHGWDVFMYCSWSHPVEYLNQSNIQVTTRCFRKSQFLDYVDCSKSYNYCNLTEGSYFSNKYMTISVEVKNTRLNVATTGTFEFDANKIVKPPPLVTVRYEILNSTCILLNWANVRPQRKKNVNVTYESEWKDPKEIVRYLVVEEDDYVIRTLCGLFPYTKYTLSFTVYPEYDGYASETISISTEKTRSSVPLHSPNTTGGAMYYKTQDCQQGNLRNVTIYWQVLEEKNWFGVRHGVSIQYNETGGLKITTVLWNISSYTMQLDCNHAYYISITAENDAGPSFPRSFLRVPKYEPDFQPPMVKVEVKEGNTSLVYVSWNVASTLDQSKVEATVFWCKKSVGSICEGQVNWKKCNSDSSTCLVSTDSPDQYTFGVSIETYAENTDDRRSTGLQWEECIYIKDKKPEISPKLSFISASEDKTLSLQWNRLTCKSASPFIIRYTVYYCKTHEKKCKGITNQKIMQPEENFLKLNNLEAEQEYGFWVTASSEWGEGPTSDWIYGTPVDTTGPTAVKFAPNITMIQEHSGLNMSCLADCYPICSWTWTKWDASMGSDHVVSTENALYIQNISRQDSGNYSCRVLNIVTGISLEIYTFINIVYGPDVIIFNPSSKIIQVDEKNFITVTCSAECFPPCQTGWEETNEEVLITGKEMKLVSIKENSSFTCHATNARKDNSTISDTIYVIVKPEINYYTTKAMTSEENTNEFPSKIHLLYVLLGIGLICAVCLLACLLRKLMSCFRMENVSTKISLTESNEDEVTETLQEENPYRYYMTIISDADGELTSAIETDFQPGTEQLLMGQNVVYIHNESERPFVSDSVTVIVNEDVDEYLTPIHSQSVQLSDYIHPVHSGPANIVLVSRRHSAEF